MSVQIQWRRDTAANWTAANPTLAQGEAGYETDTGKLKVGDGATAWVALAYYSAGSAGLGLSAGTQSVATGTVVFSNSNGISFGMAGSSRVTASYTVPSTAGLLSAINVSGGTTSNNLSALTFSDGGNVSFGLNGSVITASAPSGGGGALSVGMSTIGNTSGDTGLVESRFVLAGGNNITLSGNTGVLNRMTITVSGPNVVLPSAGTQTAESGTVVFANSNSITFGMSGSSQITASFSQSGQAFSADASSTFQTLTFQNSNGISFSNNAGALRVTHDLAGTTTAATGRAALTLNSLGLRFDGGGLAGTGFTSTTTAGTAIVATNNTSGLSLAFPAIVTNAITTARASTDAIGLNTAQTNVTWTVNSSGLSFNAAGYAGTGTSNTGAASFTLNSNGLAFNGTGLAGVGTTFAGANISGSMTMNTAGLNLSMSVAAPGAAAENNAINLLGAQTAGNTTATGSTIGWSALGNATLSGTNASQVVISVGQALSAYAVSNTVSSSSGTLDIRSVSFAGVGGASVGVSNGSVIISGGMNTQRAGWPPGNFTAVAALGNGSFSINRMEAHAPISATRLELPMLVSIASSATANTWGFAATVFGAIYTKNVSTLSSLSSGSTSFSFTLASNSAGQTQVINHAIRPYSIPVNVNMSVGEYFVGFGISTNTSSVGTATTALGITQSIMGGPIYSSAVPQVAEFTATTNTSTGLWGGQGVYSAAISTVPPTVSLSAINQTGSYYARGNFAMIFRNI